MFNLSNLRTNSHDLEKETHFRNDMSGLSYIHIIWKIYTPVFLEPKYVWTYRP